MKEVEVKIIEIDRKIVEAKLMSLGASRIFEGDQETVFLDFPSSPITGAKNLLRLRKIGSNTVLTFKKFVKDETAKVREEYEVTVSDFESMLLILELLGLHPIQRMEKHRTSYLLESGVRVDLDMYTGEFSYIPDLMEIEAGDIVKIHSCARLLGFQPSDCKSWTTFDLIDHYSEKKAKN